MFIFAIAARLLLLSGGIFAPAFRSFQLLQKGPGNEAELTAQLKHFITIACFMCAEYVADWLFFLFPLYDELKFAVVAWLCHPQLRGSIVLYDALLEQQLVQREAQIDALLVQASGNLASALFTVVGWLSSQIPKLFSSWPRRQQLQQYHKLPRLDRTHRPSSRRLQFLALADRARLLPMGTQSYQRRPWKRPLHFGRAHLPLFSRTRSRLPLPRPLRQPLAPFRSHPTRTNVARMRSAAAAAAGAPVAAVAAAAATSPRAQVCSCGRR
ncbi:TB2/DP1, HVA22 family-domain-containing protein [Blastocladiella britannica]|nr:TB2/DP1, HVA22 family-domain-containing protein [Blastocladiella britannica]